MTTETTEATEATEGINLDGMSQEELWTFFTSCKGVRPITRARKLFPSMPKGFVRATKSLANYAANKSTAMVCRARGEINSALMYEGIADRIYNELPEYAKW